MDSSSPHIGRLMLDCFRENPEDICQIDAATGESETNASVLKRTIQLARCFRSLGFEPGDVLSLTGRNQLDIFIPFYAALMCGLPISGIDPYLKYEELKRILVQTKPKIHFCQQETYEDTLRAVNDLGLDTRIVTFDGENDMKTFVGSIDCTDENGLADFEVTDFDGNKIYMWLMTTSGTTGVQKIATFTHACIANIFKYFLDGSKPQPSPCSLNLSTLQWISGYYNAIVMPLTRSTRVQTSAELTAQHIVDIINKYKPIDVITTPATASQILKHPEPCDFSCFRRIVVTGSNVRDHITTELRRRAGPGTAVLEVYGQTEACGLILRGDTDGPLGSCGQPSPFMQVKLVDPETEEEIMEPNKPGEMWAKGILFTGYYKMPEETAKVITADGWLKTGDLLYRDEDNYYFFVERIKMLIKYRGYHSWAKYCHPEEKWSSTEYQNKLYSSHNADNNLCADDVEIQTCAYACGFINKKHDISCSSCKPLRIVPTELEQVIGTFEGVQEVVVTSIPDDECMELPVACVVRAPGAEITADDVKDIVATNLSENKRLRGGVVFLEAIPMTSTGKYARATLRQLVKTAHRQ